MDEMASQTSSKEDGGREMWALQLALLLRESSFEILSWCGAYFGEHVSAESWHNSQGSLSGHGFLFLNRYFLYPNLTSWLWICSVCFAPEFVQLFVRCIEIFGVPLDWFFCNPFGENQHEKELNENRDKIDPPLVGFLEVKLPQNYC
jgi:hypothetical protein